MKVILNYLENHIKSSSSLSNLRNVSKFDDYKKMITSLLQIVWDKVQLI